jgi:hypothetical protein
MKVERGDKHVFRGPRWRVQLIASWTTHQGDRGLCVTVRALPAAAPPGTSFNLGKLLLSHYTDRPGAALRQGLEEAQNRVPGELPLPPHWLRLLQETGELARGPALRVCPWRPRTDRGVTR